MSADYNRVILVGRLTRDPELRYLESGTAVARLGLASSHRWTDPKTNEPREERCYINVDVWGRMGEVCHQYLKKGRLVLVEGRLVFRQWETPSGEKRSVHEVRADSVRFLGRPEEAVGAPPGAEEEEDDIPF